MRFRQAVPGRFFVRESYQGFGDDASDLQDAIQQYAESRDNVRFAGENYLQRCGGTTEADLPSDLYGAYQSLMAGSASEADTLNAMRASFLATGSPSVANIVDRASSVAQQMDAMTARFNNFNCITNGSTFGPTGSPTGSGTTGGGTTGGGTTGGGTTGAPGSGIPLPGGAVEAGLGLGAWLVGGGLLAAMLLFAKKQKGKPTKKATKKRTIRRAPRRRTTRRRR
jgi:hypothetical protein